MKPVNRSTAEVTNTCSIRGLFKRVSDVAFLNEGTPAVPLHVSSYIFQRSSMLTENGTGNLLCGTPTHPLFWFKANSRHGGLHVTPASAEVVSEFVQRIDAQFLPEVGVLLLFGGQDLPQCPDLLFQLDTNTKAEASHSAVTTPCSFLEGATHTLASSWRISSLSSSVMRELFKLTSDPESSSVSFKGPEARKPVDVKRH